MNFLHSRGYLSFYCFKTNFIKFSIYEHNCTLEFSARKLLWCTVYSQARYTVNIYGIPRTSHTCLIDYISTYEYPPGKIE